MYVMKNRNRFVEIVLGTKTLCLVVLDIKANCLLLHQKGQEKILQKFSS